MPTVYTVIVQPCTDTTGYWAKCDFPGGGCTVQGETIHETQKNMLEALSLYLEDSVVNYLLTWHNYPFLPGNVGVAAVSLMFSSDEIA